MGKPLNLGMQMPKSEGGGSLVLARSGRYQGQKEAWTSLQRSDFAKQAARQDLEQDGRNHPAGHGRGSGFGVWVGGGEERGVALATP